MVIFHSYVSLPEGIIYYYYGTELPLQLDMAMAWQRLARFSGRLIS